ncbi:acetylxylan esterase [Streptomyces sp. NPDC002550]
MSPPEDFDVFRQQTLAEARARGGAVKAERVTDRYLLSTVDVYDIRFPGWNGEPVAASLLRPRGIEGPLPVVLTFLGYCAGRGLPTDHLLWSAAGYARLVVDSRGQGHDTPDRTEGDGTQWVELHDPRHRLTPQPLLPTPHDGLCAPALFSVDLMDPTCPPPTVYAAFNHYAGTDRTMTAWPFADHGGGFGFNTAEQLKWLRERGLAPQQ